MQLLRRILLSITALFSFALVMGLAATPAQAQATRTWVSGVGDDANPCSRTAPCKTFAGAISKTAAGGEINCLDPAGYGAVTITKSMTIDCTGTFGSVLNTSVNGIIVNAAGIEVRLRGISINGSDGANSGARGIYLLAASTLTVEDVFIANQVGSPGSGITIAPSAGTVLVNVSNTLINNAGAGAGSGIDVTPTGSSLVRLSLRNVQILNSSGNALRLDSTGGSGLGILAVIENSNISSATGAGISAVAGNAGTPFNVTLLTNSTLSNNGGAGISTSGSAARVRVANTAISLNGTGVSPGSGFINNLGGNIVVGNSVDGSFN